ITPAEAGYHAETLPIRRDPEFGDKLKGDEVVLHNFAFPFSGKSWTSFSAGVSGSIRFGPAQGSGRSDARADRGGGVSIGRFDPLQDAAARLINSVPAICVFFKLRMSGPRFVKESPDRV